MEMVFNLEKSEDIIRLSEYFIGEICKIKQTDAELDRLEAIKDKARDAFTKIGDKLFVGDTATYKDCLSDKEVCRLQKQYTKNFLLYDSTFKQVGEILKAASDACNKLIADLKMFLVAWDNFKAETISSEMIEFMRRSCALGFPLYQSSDIHALKGFAALNDEKLVESFVALLIGNDFLTLRNAVAGYTSLNFEPEHIYFKCALDCLYNGNFYSCACSMFPLIENLLVRTQFFTNTEKRHLFAKGISDYFEKNNHRFYKEAWQNLNLLIENIYNRFDRKQSSQSHFINRHQIEHGDFARDVTVVDCLTLILLYMSLSESVTLMAVEHYTAEMNARNKKHEEMMKETMLQSKKL